MTLVFPSSLTGKHSLFSRTCDEYFGGLKTLSLVLLVLSFKGWFAFVPYPRLLLFSHKTYSSTVPLSSRETMLKWEETFWSLFLPWWQHEGIFVPMLAESLSLLLPASPEGRPQDFVHDSVPCLLCNSPILSIISDVLLGESDISIPPISFEKDPPSKSWQDGYRESFTALPILCSIISVVQSLKISWWSSSNLDVLLQTTSTHSISASCKYVKNSRSFGFELPPKKSLFPPKLHSSSTFKISGPSPLSR